MSILSPNIMGDPSRGLMGPNTVGIMPRLPGRADALAYFRGAALTDVIGKSTITVISGTTWADWVVTLESTPALLAADTGHIFFTSADIPRQVRLSALSKNNLNYAFAGNGILIIYSSPQSATNITRILRYIRNYAATAYGGYFTFAADAAATAKFRIDTVGGVPWILDNQYVASGAFATVNKDTTRSISIGVSNTALTSIQFFNETYSTNKVNFPLSIVSDMRPSSSIYLYAMPLATGLLSCLSDMRPTGILYLNNMPLVTGSFDDLSELRPATSVYLQLLSNISICGPNNQLFSLAKTIRVDGCALTESSVDNILAAVVAGGQTNGTFNSSGGTNSAPSAAGEVSVALLTMAGWSVTVTA